LPINAHPDSGDDVACADPGCGSDVLARADAYRQAVAYSDAHPAAYRDTHPAAHRDTHPYPADAHASPHADALSASSHLDGNAYPGPAHRDFPSYGDGQTTYFHTDERLSLPAGSAGMARSFASLP
jgi:hypothetical protein